MFSNHRMPIFLGIVALLSVDQLVTADCSRDILISTADSYVAAQTSGQLGTLATLLTSTYSYRENNKASTVPSGILSTALNISHRKTTADTVACASFTELVALTPKPYVIGTQLRHTANGSAVTLIDTIAATTGALSFDASRTLGYIQKETWSTIPTASQDSRAMLQAAADAYLDMWTNASAYNAVPWGTPCERVEGSALNSPCTVGAPKGGYTQRIDDRRYVIDQMFGSADVLCNFAAVGGVADSHEFRLESGKLRFFTLTWLNDETTVGPINDSPSRISSPAQRFAPLNDSRITRQCRLRHTAQSTPACHPISGNSKLYEAKYLKLTAPPPVTQRPAAPEASVQASCLRLVLAMQQFPVAAVARLSTEAEYVRKQQAQRAASGLAPLSEHVIDEQLKGKSVPQFVEVLERMDVQGKEWGFRLNMEGKGCLAERILEIVKK
ncbi:hypothetical protein LSUE1_G008966, partial [Lachnellula suecica]